jgi:multidrug resistance efflux pump
MATPTESRLEPSTNGSLVDRVHQLRLDDQLAGGGKSVAARGSLLPWVLCGLLAVTWVGVGVRWYKSASHEGGVAPAAGANPNPAPPSGPRPSADTQAAAPGELVTQLKGTVIPSLQITVSPRDVAAEITDIYFAEGKRVKRGETLATLLDAQYANRLKSDEAALEAAKAMVVRAKAGQTQSRAKVAKAEAALASAKARVARAVATQSRANKDYAQAVEQQKVGAIAAQEYQKFEADKLAADADKVAADADVEAAAREVEAAKAELNTAAANIASAEADERAADARRKETARLVDNCTVRAPIDGIILTKSADKGALVSPMSFNVAAGICTIADLSKLEVEIDVPERQITRLQKGQACVLQADADPTREYRGVVDRVMPIADDTKNVVKVRIRAYLKTGEEQGAFLKPKMSVTATVYNRQFQFDPAKDQAWGDEKKK